MYYEQQSENDIEPEKVIYIQKNGDSHGDEIKFNLYKKHKIRDVGQILQENQFFKNIKNIRLFNQQGVELSEQDFQYLQNGDKIIVSQGEEFDQNSYFQLYQKIKDLGQGGFGKVYLAMHKQTKQLVAIKLVDSHHLSNAIDIDSIFKEGNILKNLQHKNIVNIFNCYTLDNKQVVFIMEYLSGGELTNYVENKGRLSEYEALIIIDQLQQAIRYCHRQGIIHRDLKLENIMLKSQNDISLIKLVDFGISGGTLNINLENLNVGSLKYMPPEILARKVNRIGPSIDTWAIGVIMYTIVCGKFPFSGNFSHEVAYKIVNNSIIFPKNIERSLSPQFKDLVTQLLIKDPKQRIDLKNIMNHPWLNHSQIKRMDIEIIDEKQDEGVVPKIYNQKKEQLKNVYFRTVIKRGNSPLERIRDNVQDTISDDLKVIEQQKTIVSNTQPKEKDIVFEKLQVQLEKNIQEIKNYERSKSRSRSPKPLYRDENLYHNYDQRLGRAIANVCCLSKEQLSNKCSQNNRVKIIKFPMLVNNKISRSISPNRSLSPHCIKKIQ